MVAILRDGTEYEELTGRRAPAELVLDRTPFYAEGGGQVGDRGVLREPGGGLGSVHGRGHAAAGRRPDRPSRPLHGRVAVGETVTAEVDAERRARTMRNHTGTHLLHRALRNTSASRRARRARSSPPTTCASTSRSTGR